jgi:hypothetical protein
VDLDEFLFFLRPGDTDLLAQKIEVVYIDRIASPLSGDEY